MREKPKILVVDDDRRMVKTICDILRVKGYEAVMACSGEEAVQTVKGELFDCVLMDIKMPVIDGVKALKMIKSVSPDSPVVLMSANATYEQAEEAKLYGAAIILTKPLEIDNLIRIIEDISRRKRNALLGEPFNYEVI